MTYVLVEEDSRRVVGFHALTVASISHEDATVRARKRMPRHPIPADLLRAPPSDPFNLQLLIKDIRSSLDSTGV